MPVQNAEIAALLNQEAELLEIQGANPFRVRAYRRAAQTIGALPRSVASILAAEEDLTALPGIGQDLAGKIAEIVKTGRFPALDDLKREVPGDLAAIATLPGASPDVSIPWTAFDLAGFSLPTDRTLIVKHTGAGGVVSYELFTVIFPAP